MISVGPDAAAAVCLTDTNKTKMEKDTYNKINTHTYDARRHVENVSPLAAPWTEARDVIVEGRVKRICTQAKLLQRLEQVPSPKDSKQEKISIGRTTARIF